MTAAAVGMAVGTAPAKAAQAKPATRRVAGPRPTVDGSAVEVGGNHRHAGPLAERERPDPGGRPLPDTVGRRLARVVGAQAVAAARVHTDRAADALAADNDAHAVTIGTDIFFAAGRYRPGTREGDWIIAHEVAHVAQAQRGLLDRPAFLAVAPSAPTPLEAAADQVADQLAAGPEEKPDEQQAPQPEGAPGAATADGVAQAPAGAPVADGGAALAQAGPETAGAPGPEPEAGPQPAATEAAPRADLPADLPRMPEPAVELSPAEQGRVGGVQQRAGAVTKANTAVPAAADNVATGTAAVQVPQQESDARAAGLLVDAVATKEKPSIEVEELCKRIRLLIAEKRPADEDAVVDTRPAQVAAEAGQGVATGVQQNVDATQASYGNLGTDPTGPAPAAAPGLEPLAPAEPTSPVAAAAATPDAVPPDQASLDEDTAAMAEKSRNAGLEKDAAQLVRSGPVAEAREAQGELGTLAADGPADALAAQQAALAKSDADLAALQAKAVASLQAARSGHVGGVADQQQALKEGSEGLRARLSARAEKAFTEAQDRVQELLSAVPQTAMGRWTAGLAPLTERFNTDLKVVKGKVEERHEGVSGFFVAGWDAVTGLPDWVKEAYDNAEKNFGDGVCTLILDISSYVNGIIKIADEIITTARTDITTIFTTDLPAEDQAWAAEQLKGFGTKLDALHERAESTRTSFTKELLENAGNAVQAAREKIQKLRKEAQGLWGRFLDAVGRFLDDPVKFIIDGLLEILGISPPAFWAVVDKIKKYAAAIVDAPIAFASNLMDGVAAGFQLFFDHIGTHLIAGLLEWLLSGLKREGLTIEIPKELSLRNVVVFFLQLLGLSWARIRKLLVEQLGEKPVAVIEKAAGVIATLATKGISGIFDDIEKMLEPKTIIDTIIDTAIRFISETLIVKVAEKIILLFNPVGAILAALEAIYRILKWIFTNAARIFHLIEAVVNGLGDVISGNVAGVAKTVEKALAMLVAPVIDFLADYLGLGGLPGKVATAVKGLQGWVEGVLRSVIKWLVEMGRKLLAKLGFGGKEDEKQPETAGDVGEDVAFSGGGASHKLFIAEGVDNATLMVASTPMKLTNRLADFRGRATGVGGMLPFFSNEAERDRALALIRTLETKEKEADQNADLLVREHRKQVREGGPARTAEAADRVLADEERTIGSLLSELYDLFEENPGDDVLEMRAPYSGDAGSGEVSYRRKKETAKTAYVMGSGSISGRVLGQYRGRVQSEADALAAALGKQASDPALAPLGRAIPELKAAAGAGEALAKKLLGGQKAKPEPPELQAALDRAATSAGTIASFALIGGGEILERAMTALIDDIRTAGRPGVFTTVSAMRTEIARLTAQAQLQRRQDPEKTQSTTRFFVPGKGLLPDKEPGAAGATIRYTGAEVSGVASYAEILAAVEHAVTGLGPLLVKAVHDVPVGRINATMQVVLRGREVSKDQDKFLGELALLLRLEMVRAATAWAFTVPRLILATSAADVGRALSADVFPHVAGGFVEAYREWGPKVFDKASETLLDALAVEFAEKEGLRAGAQIFISVVGTRSAIDAVKVKLRAAYDRAVSEL